MAYGVRPNKHQERSERTRQRILDAAEILFAPAGSGGVSMRQVAAAVGVDLSLVTYHFKSKDELHHAVIERAYVDFTDQRLKRLDALESRKAPPTVLELFDVLINCWFDLLSGKMPHRAQLLVRGLNPDSYAKEDSDWISDPFAKRFLNDLSKAAPNVPISKVHWAYHFFTGSIVYCVGTSYRIRRLSAGVCNIDSRKALRQALLEFVKDAFDIQEGASDGQGRLHVA